ncbi:protein kinase [Candidatus Obscuribacterales bacterium]|nr:protein kinase [Candidatus Obscuribacterales bacterium]
MTFWFFDKFILLVSNRYVNISPGVTYEISKPAALFVMTTTAQSEDFCSKCGKQKRELKKMSLTQWVFAADACNCDSPVRNSEAAISNEFTSMVEICDQCGRPVVASRAGSMTQWIFRANSCSCAAKQSLNQSGERARNNKTSTSRPSEKVSRTSVLDDQIGEEPTPLTIELGLPEGRYQVLQLVGSGAVSKVYKCLDKLLQRDVAIKFLINDRWTNHDLMQFQTEAKATSKLTHPNIITVHDFGLTTKGQPYMVLEFFTGVSLQDLISTRGPLPEDIAAEIGAQIAAAMQYAHGKGVLHRDIKPENIMLIETDDNIVAKIIDFGIADLNANERLAVDGNSLAGTPSYMSPDQLAGKNADARSDIYSLGCTLFEAMTGRPPFEGASSLEIVTKHANESPPTLQEALPERIFSDTIEQAIATTLRKDPEQRFENMADLHSALVSLHQPAAPLSNIDSTVPDTTPVNRSVASGQKLTAGIVSLIALSIGILLVGVALLAPILTKSETSYGDDTKKRRSAYQTPEKLDDIRWQSPFGPDIQENMQTNEVLKEFEHRRNVQNISIRGANINDDGLKYIMNCGVYSLGLEASKISNKGFKQICSIKTLRLLNLSHCPQLTDYSCLKLCPELTSLWLLNNELTDKELENFDGLQKLNSTNLSGNPRITGTGFIHFRNLKALRDLRLNSLQFTTDGIKQLSELKQVELLQLRYSNITDADLDQIVTMSNLRSLSLIRTDISDSGIMKLAKLPHLETVFLGTCKDVTPEGIAKLQKRRPRLVIDTNQAYSL